jgi:hypothetical protein
MYRVLVLLGFLTATPVLAHGWYDPDCCNNRDCSVYIHEIEALPGGAYRLANGQVVPAAKVKRSQDVKFHLCRWDGMINCFYVPDAKGGRARRPGAVPTDLRGLFPQDLLTTGNMGSSSVANIDRRTRVP